MMRAVGVLATAAIVQGIIVVPAGVVVPDAVPVLDSHNLANGCLGHVERAWPADGILLGEMVFTGRGQPPAEAPDSAAVRRRVADHPDMIGYIDRGALDPSVRAVMVVQ